MSAYEIAVDGRTWRVVDADAIVLARDSHNDADWREVAADLRRTRHQYVADEIEAQTRPPKPPKPEEPTGLGAVVEDVVGEKWVWLANGAEGAYWRRVGVGERWSTYGEINAVRVLSAGVSA